MDRTVAPAQLSVQQHTATDSGDLTQVSPARRVRQLLADVREHGARKRKTLLQTSLAVRDEAAEPVVKKVHRRGTPAAPINGLFEVDHGGRRRVVEYEPDSELRDTEQIPLQEEGGIEGFLRREVLPYAPDAWVVPESVKIGYEISFNRYFYKPQPMRTLGDIQADIVQVERETEKLMHDILGMGRGDGDEAHCHG